MAQPIVSDEEREDEELRVIPPIVWPDTATNPWVDAQGYDSDIDTQEDAIEEDPPTPQDVEAVLSVPYNPMMTFYLLEGYNMNPGFLADLNNDGELYTDIDLEGYVTDNEFSESDTD
jgi:hypothetical protein